MDSSHSRRFKVLYPGRLAVVVTLCAVACDSRTNIGDGGIDSGPAETKRDVQSPSGQEQVLEDPAPELKRADTEEVTRAGKRQSDAAGRLQLEEIGYFLIAGAGELDSGTLKGGSLELTRSYAGRNSILAQSVNKAIETANKNKNILSSGLLRSAHIEKTDHGFSDLLSKLHQGSLIHGSWLGDTFKISQDHSGYWLAGFRQKPSGIALTGEEKPLFIFISPSGRFSVR